MAVAPPDTIVHGHFETAAATYHSREVQQGKAHSLRKGIRRTTKKAALWLVATFELNVQKYAERMRE
jgi:hypothetical protein